MLDVLPVSDVQAIVRLLGKLSVCSATTAEKRRMLLGGLVSLIDADGWWWVHSAVRDGNAYLFSVVDGGWLDENQRHLATTVHYTPHIEIFNAYFRPFEARGESITRTRDQIVSDAQWYTSRAYLDYFKPAGVEDFMGAIYPLENHLMSAIGLHRNHGKPMFSDRERTLVHIVFSEIDWLHREGTDAPVTSKAPGLTPRQRQILLLLLQGDNRKQIAHKLKISEFTVSDHLKVIHIHFKVNSRSELLAQFIAGSDTVTQI